MKFNLATEFSTTNHVGSLYDQFKNEVFNLFIQVFEKMLGQGQLPTFDPTMNKVLAALNLSEYAAIFSKDCSLWFDKITKFEYLKNWLDDEKIREIIVHSHNFLQIELAGNFHNINTILLSASDYQLSINYLALQNGQEINFSNPFASFYTQLSSRHFRATIIHQSTSPTNGLKIFLRKIQKQIFPLDRFVPPNGRELLAKIVEEKANVIISGATGSGKTALLTSMAQQIPSNEHLIILEDTYEIIMERQNITSMLANHQRPNNSLKDYCAYALRMRPDRIIVGELRSHEIIPFILAMNTGHSGLLSSIHANSAVDALHRLATLFCLYGESRDISFELIMKLICKNLHYVIHMNQRRVAHVIKVIGVDRTTPSFETVYQQAANFS